MTAPTDSALAGWTAVVTGASRGIGQATMRALSRGGSRVIGLSRSGLPTGEVALPGETSMVVDLTDPIAIGRIVDAIIAAFGGVPDLLVNNAGEFAIAPIEQTSPVTFSRMLALNLGAPFQLIHAFVPGMRARGRGHVVTIGSIADHVAFPGNSAYSAGKFGVRGLHEVLRAELKGTGVRATLVSPAGVDTPLWDQFDAATRSQFPSPSEMLDAADVADAILYAVTRPRGVDIDEIRISAA